MEIKIEIKGKSAEELGSLGAAHLKEYIACKIGADINEISVSCEAYKHDDKYITKDKLNTVSWFQTIIEKA
jgi:hypothetical protein